ncbi:MAG: TraR/DksA C4-type zinc finger protein [candidate division Zixibacteria bacterium]
MNKRDLAKYEKLLLEKRKQLIDEFGLLKSSGMDATIKDKTGDLSSYSYHMADQGTDAMEREKTFYFASKSGRLLHHIDEALRRVRNKTYGKCEQCSETINTERLMAVPHARLCIACKETEETKKRG